MQAVLSSSSSSLSDFSPPPCHNNRHERDGRSSGGNTPMLSNGVGSPSSIRNGVTSPENVRRSLLRPDDSSGSLPDLCGVGKLSLCQSEGLSPGLAEKDGQRSQSESNILESSSQALKGAEASGLSCSDGGDMCNIVDRTANLTADDGVDRTEKVTSECNATDGHMCERETECNLLKPPRDESRTERSSDTIQTDGDEIRESSPRRLADDDLDEIDLTASDDHARSPEVDSGRGTLERGATPPPVCLDTVSFSSLSSGSTGLEPGGSSATALEEDSPGSRCEGDDGSFVDVDLLSQKSVDSAGQPLAPSPRSSGAVGFGQRKKGGGFSLLGRALFSRKEKEGKGDEESTNLSQEPVRQGATSSPKDIDADFKPKGSPGRARRDVDVSSTTALILEQRPSHLPAKSAEEERKHEEQYRQMVESARKSEARAVAKRSKTLAERMKAEEQRAKAAAVWTKDVIPNWNSARSSRRTKELWWKGVPPAVRGKVWKLALGNDLSITPELYEICLARARERLKAVDEGSDTDSLSDISVSREGSVEQIRLDVSRTFPQLGIFQKGGPYHELLHNVLAAYACYRPDVGYVQGMSFLCAVLLLNLDPAESFISLANLLNRPVFLSFFRLEQSQMWAYFAAYEELLHENLPRLYTHLKSLSLKPELYLIDWVLTLFSRALPLDLASRVWDLFLRDGDEMLFRIAMALLKVYSQVLLGLDFDHLAKFLTRLPDTIDEVKLFKAAESIKMNSGRRSFHNILDAYKQVKV